MSDLKYWAALNAFQKFGPVRFNKIKKYFVNMEEAFKSSAKVLIAAGIEESVAEEFIIKRSQINPDKIMEELDREKISLLTIEDQNYSHLLKEIYNPPWLLYYKGNIDLNNEFTIGVVGTRKISSYGRMVTESIVKDLINNNLTIVSGLALGVDSVAHETTVRSGGKTIAVLGTGLDRQSIYPSANKYLFDQIILNNGGIISEFPPGTQPLRYNFPLRNRIISGLSLGILVIEAGEKSGALITADLALEQNREVFAVPGSIFSESSKGPNRIIKLGARAVTSAQDIIEAFNLKQAISQIETKKIIPESKEEEIILSFLSHEPLHVDELRHLAKLDTSVINSTLTIMEIKGMVRNLGGMMYVLSR
jgi:DNA processing protein